MDFIADERCTPTSARTSARFISPSVFQLRAFLKALNSIRCETGIIPALYALSICEFALCVLVSFVAACAVFFDMFLPPVIVIAGRCKRIHLPASDCYLLLSVKLIMLYSS